MPDTEQNATTGPEASPPGTPDLPGAPFTGYVVAVGASAGGLEALERFFRHCPADTGAAFVVIQHLSPDHKSMMHDLLGRYTAMPVRVVEDGLPIEPNRVYLIPPGTIMRIASERFHLTPKHPHLLTLPIDIFLNSLADAVGPRAIGVILSGTGSDGTRGAAAINAAGGLLLAQEPQDAKFDGMPSSVIATGLVDAVLRADALGERLVAHIRNLPPPPAESQPRQRPALSPEAALEGIVKLLLDTCGIDFNDYKRATLMRRIERRMQVRHAPSLDTYLTLLEQDRREVSTLRTDILIPVTSFFRDADAFETLNRAVVTDLVERTPPGGSIRVWVAGTSTGEEAYSIAMLFLEAFERARRWPQLKVFATDVNLQNVEFAAAGQYPESAAAELSPERLARFFTRTDAHFTVRPELRQSIVFARHNLLADPPFTRMSLVSCRNTLIYFTPEAQRRALLRLQYAIQPEGYLFLGSSESLSGLSNGFVPVEARHKVFRRAPGNLPSGFGSTPSASRKTRADAGVRPAAPARSANHDSETVEEAVGALLNHYAPPSMLVNDRQEVIHMFGRVRPYFQAREGSASLHLNRLLPDRLVPVAAALLFKAAKDRDRIVSDLLQVTLDDGATRLVRLSVTPLKPRDDEKLLLLSFEEPAQTLAATSPAESVDVAAESVARIDVLERELAATRESLQATIEELETSNEELQATNEELMAANEELQSSNEELQSINEELNTVNAEYQEKVVVLHQLNADLDTMARAVGVATLFVDRELRLTRYSPDAVKLFKLREGDIGRPLDEIAHVLKYPSLIDDLRRTIDDGRLVEHRSNGPDDRLYLTRILPYGNVGANLGGAVATFVDITDFRDRQRLQTVLDALPEHIAVLEQDGTIALVNAAWTRFARANGDPGLTRSGVGVNYLEICRPGPDEANAGGARRAWKGIKSVLEGSAATFSMEYPCHSPHEQRWFVMNVAPIREHEFGAVVSHVDISAWYARHTRGEEGA